VAYDWCVSLSHTGTVQYSTAFYILKSLESSEKKVLMVGEFRSYPCK
jgi:hypothetical protein